MSRGRHGAVFAGAAVAVYLALAVNNIRTFLPWCDEGWFADPALNLLTTGSMGTVVLDPTATFRTVRLDGIHRHTYWIMPVYILAQAAWYKLAGFGLFSMRALSLVWGLVAMGSWYAIVRRLAEDRGAALLTLGLLGVDFLFISSSTVGRMDVMCVALGSAAIALYLHLRAGSFGRAVLIPHTLVAIALFTHPNAVILFLDLCFLALYFDARRIRVSTVVLAAAPYVAGLAGWGLYIAQDPGLFRLQFLGNAGNSADRLLFVTRPLEAIRLEVELRYLQHFGMPPYSQGASRLKLVILAAYVAGIAGVAFSRKLRARRGVRALAGIAAIHFLGLTLIDGFKQHLYLIYVAPLFVALFAVFAAHSWREARVPRPALAAIMAVLVIVQLAVTGARIRQDAYHRRYLAAAEFLKGRGGGVSRTVMASAEMGFQLGFTPMLVDDYRLGYRSGTRPEFIVIDEARYGAWIPLLAEQDPGNYAYIQDLLRARYHAAYDREGYRIYERN